MIFEILNIEWDNINVLSNIVEKSSGLLKKISLSPIILLNSKTTIL
jgi:hypothetical protein